MPAPSSLRNSVFVARFPRKLALMSSTSASKSPALSGLSATRTAVPSRLPTPSSQSRTFRTRPCASSSVRAGRRPTATSGSRSSPLIAPSVGSEDVHRYDVFAHCAGSGDPWSRPVKFRGS